ncbi:MAG: nucleotidyl transferase AbiEii/AbiGii toxin family protein [Verrucomicrobiales bacterium]|nr:nucleotidyl transferase AbiEii/AbiGii toxin family protein [Verrucomicrobiales bacterium]
MLPDFQRRLWPKLGAVPGFFVLYGGTALALRLGHRQSVDFDFFSARSFGPEELRSRLPFAADSEVVQVEKNTLTIRCPGGDGVLVSFLGGLHASPIELPDACADTGLRVAGLRDLLAAKLNVVFQRAEAKDYLDVHALLNTGLTLSEGLATARAVYGPTFNPTLPLKALTFFEDGDLPSLPHRIQQDLTEAVRRVVNIPEIPPTGFRIGEHYG